MPMLTRVLALTLGLLVCLTSISPALAAAPDAGLGISPLDYAGQFFDITLKPGESRDLKVEVGNHGAETTSARTYPANVYTIVNGGFGAALDDSHPTGTTLWVDYPQKTLDLGAGKALQQGFTVHVPQDAAPGEYITSLVVETATPTTTSTNGGGVALKQVKRNVLAVVVTVPGPRLPALAIGSFEHKVVAGTSVITATVQNTGNVRLAPSGALVLKDAQGSEVTRYPIAMGTFYAGTSTTIEVPFATTLSEGAYVVSLELSDGASGVTAAQSAPIDIRIPKNAPPAPAAGGGRADANQTRPANAAPWLDRAVPFALPALIAALVLAAACMLLVRVRLRRVSRERRRVQFVASIDRWRGQHGQRSSSENRR
jgi:hypothetical protein